MVVSEYASYTEVFIHDAQRLLLSIKAELENVTDLVPATDSYEYFFQVCAISPMRYSVNIHCSYACRYVGEMHEL